MKIKECKDYLNNLISLNKDVNKKNKWIASLFTILVSLLSVIPVACILINLFMQFLGIKIMIISLIILCGVILHLIIALMYPVYFISLNELSEKENEIKELISYKKIFTALISDWYQIIFIMIMIILVAFIVVRMLF